MYVLSFIFLHLMFWGTFWNTQIQNENWKDLIRISTIMYCSKQYNILRCLLQHIVVLIRIFF